MKKLLLSIVMMGFCTNLVCEKIVTKDQMSPDQLKTMLFNKYQGKINGIDSISRAVTDIGGIVGGATAKQKIDAAANQLSGMGSIDLDRVEADIEKTLHDTLTYIFKQSIDLADKTYAHEVSDKLFAISPWNKKIVWSPDQTRVLMLTWIPAAYKGTYEKHLNSGEPMIISWDAWVTAVPEVKDFLKEYARNSNGFSLTDRTEQFLGLIPSKPPYATSQNKLFVEMWVRPQDIFRPCLDAETIDSSCMIDPHESDLDSLPPVFRDMSQLVAMTPEHKKWFDNEKKVKYMGQWAMPWTRFGYTYDWGSLKKAAGKRAAQGASEYLLKRNSAVIIQSIIPTDNYPNVPTPRSGYIAQD